MPQLLYANCGVISLFFKKLGEHCHYFGSFLRNCHWDDSLRGLSGLYPTNNNRKMIFFTPQLLYANVV